MRKADVDRAYEPVSTRAVRRARGLAGRAKRRVQRRVQQVQEDRRVVGPKPPVEPETTHYGPRIDALVERLRRLQRHTGVNPDYDELREHFDHYHYVLQAWELDPDIDPIRRFLRAGADAKNMPDPNFSMTKYLRRYPERREGSERSPYLEWLRHGKELGEIADPADGIEVLAPVLGLEPQEVLDEVVALRTDMFQRLRTGTLGEMYAKAIELEPLIAETVRDTARGVAQLPLRNESVAGAVAAIQAAHKAAAYRRARVLFVVDGPASHGRTIEDELVKAMAETVSPEEVVVIYTDQGGTARPGRFPSGVREVDFATSLERVGPMDSEMALVSLVRSFRSEAVVVVDSELMHRSLQPYGKALAHSERVFLCYGTKGSRPTSAEGWASRTFYSSTDVVEGYLTDSERYRDEVSEHFLLDADDQARIRLLPAPVTDAPGTPQPADAPGRPLVRWIGGQAAHDPSDIPQALAERMPDVDFELWGELTLQGDPSRSLPDNVRAMGEFDSLAQVTEGGASVVLVTGRWHAPAELVALAVTGTPIVATPDGTAAEVLGSESTPVADGSSVEEYEKALRAVLSDRDGAVRRAGVLRDRLVAERDWTGYVARAAQILLPAPQSDEALEEAAQ